MHREGTDHTVSQPVIEAAYPDTATKVRLVRAMVAEVLCDLTPRYHPRQVLDNLPEIGG